MPRIRRVCPPGSAQHVINRGNGRRTIFHQSADYQAFLRLLREAQQRISMPILAYCLMPNHFHLLLLPPSAAALSAYMRWLMNVHVRRYHEHYMSTGTGHIYQGRYRNFSIQMDRYLLNAWKYVEGNALRAGLVKRAEDWRWSSLYADESSERPALCKSPVDQPASWLDWVNDSFAPEELTSVRRSVQRGAPYGDDEWACQIAKAHDLEFTLRARGRPKREKGDTHLFAGLSDFAKR